MKSFRNPTQPIAPYSIIPEETVPAVAETLLQEMDSAYSYQKLSEKQRQTSLKQLEEMLSDPSRGGVYHPLLLLISVKALGQSTENQFRPKPDKILDMADEREPYFTQMYPEVSRAWKAQLRQARLDMHYRSNPDQYSM